MKRSVAIGLAVLFLASLVALGITAMSREASSAAPIDVVVLRCAGTGGGEVTVAQSDSSPGAPTFAADTSCASALSSLLKKSFRFQAVHGDDVFLYTMVKP
ncbi:MAG TPA: hypothetical protein VGL11_14560 [Candidatus Binatia bacterium]|jgi:hypothetical protein